MGATTICDGSAIVERLPDALREEMSQRHLRYTRQAVPEELSFWFGTAAPSDAQLAAPPESCPFMFRREGEQVRRSFSRPFLHRPMFTDRLAFGNFLLFARYGIGRWDFPLFDDDTPVPTDWTDTVRDIGEDLSAAVAWRKGDLLMLDNTRFMHGRTAIVPRDRRLIMSHFGYLNFALPSPEDPPNTPWRRERTWPPYLAKGG